MSSKPILAEDLENEIHTKLIAKKIFAFETLSSTNDFAKRLAQNDDHDGTLVLANEQTKGRGRQGRHWYAPPNFGLWFSIILKPNQPAQKFGIVSLLAAVAVAQTIEQMTSLEPALKWPNDVFINSKKVSGVLIESQFSNNQPVSLILGFGLNVNQKQGDFPEEIRETATSLREQIKYEIDRVSLLINLLHNLEHLYFEFKKGNFNVIINFWKERCPFLGKDVSIKQSRGEIEGRFENLDEYGRMILRLEKGEIKHLNAGEQTVIQGGEPCYS